MSITLEPKASTSATVVGSPKKVIAKHTANTTARDDFMVRPTLVGGRQRRSQSHPASAEKIRDLQSALSIHTVTGNAAR